MLNQKSISNLFHTVSTSKTTSSMPNSNSNNHNNLNNNQKSTSNGQFQTQQQQQPNENELIHLLLTKNLNSKGDSNKEFDDVVFDILKVDPDEIAVSVSSFRDCCSFE
jgi:hypothetical protein